MSKKTLPETGTLEIGGRTYEYLSVLQPNEMVNGRVVLERAVAADANTGEDDHKWFENHGDNIPRELRAKAHFVFPLAQQDGPKGRMVGVTEWSDGLFPVAANQRGFWPASWAVIDTDWAGPGWRVVRRVR